MISDNQINNKSKEVSPGSFISSGTSGFTFERYKNLFSKTKVFVPWSNVLSFSLESEMIDFSRIPQPPPGSLIKMPFQYLYIKYKNANERIEKIHCLTGSKKIQELLTEAVKNLDNSIISPSISEFLKKGETTEFKHLANQSTKSNFRVLASLLIVLALLLFFIFVFKK
ncbi:MAG: hypothetical protein Q7K55_05095 [Candidatus Levybacteria bacterium]|nr:hypothetical protein [Candidatus Levybacteria bacterium]